MSQSASPSPRLVSFGDQPNSPSLGVVSPRSRGRVSFAQPGDDTPTTLRASSSFDTLRALTHEEVEAGSPPSRTQSEVWEGDGGRRRSMAGSEASETSTVRPRRTSSSRKSGPSPRSMGVPSFRLDRRRSTMHMVSLSPTARFQRQQTIDYSDLITAPTYSVKVHTEMQYSLRTPLVLTIIKDCTAHYFIVAVLRKYRAQVHRTGAQLGPVKANECALAATNADLPRPLPLERKRNMKEQLIALHVPYPFVVTLIMDPDVIRRREEEARMEALRLEEERRSREEMEDLMNRMHRTEIEELCARESVERTSLMEWEPEEGALLDVCFEEFLEVTQMQHLKEEQEARDALSDRQFFERLREDQGSQVERDERHRRRTEDGHAQALVRREALVLRRLLKVSVREVVERMRIVLYARENEGRLEVERVERVHRSLIREMQIEETDRMATMQGEAAGFVALRDAEFAHRIHVLTIIGRSREYIRRLKHADDLSRIIDQLDGEIARPASVVGSSRPAVLPSVVSVSDYNNTAGSEPVVESLKLLHKRAGNPVEAIARLGRRADRRGGDVRPGTSQGLPPTYVAALQSVPRPATHPVGPTRGKRRPRAESKGKSRGLALPILRPASCRVRS